MDNLSSLRTIQIWFYLIILIPSIFCSLLVLYCFLFDRNLPRALNNHTIIVLLLICLICQVTIYPWMVYFYYYRTTWQRSYVFCNIWAFIDWGLFITQTILCAWTSIERHILIFHSGWIATRKKRFFVHYLPLIILLIYCLLFYSIIYLFPLCENFMDNMVTVCASSCLFYNSSILNMWETIGHQILPILLIILFSLALLFRVLRQKQRMRQAIQWRKHRKMTIQLLSISFLYLLFSFPNTAIILMYICGLSYEQGEHAKVYVVFFSYLVILFFPFVCVLSMSQVRKRMKNILCLQRRVRTIAPEIVVPANPIKTQNAFCLENLDQ